MAKVVLVLDTFRKSSQRELIAEEAFLYRLYRQAFARFAHPGPSETRRNDP